MNRAILDPAPCLLYAATPEFKIGAFAIDCPTAPITTNVPMNGTLNQNTDCFVVIPSSFGSLNALADVYHLSALTGSTVRVTLDSKSMGFGLPYIGIVDADDQIVRAAIGSVPIGADGFRATLLHPVATTGRIGVLVSGVGGPFSTAVGSYTLTVTFTAPSKRRAVRQ